jgi:Zn-dependent protease with chaperone function
MPVVVETQDTIEELAEQPLPPLQNGLYLLRASLLVAAFYLYCLMVLLLGVSLAAAALVASFMWAHWGSFIVCGPAFLVLGRVMLAVVQGLRPKRGVDYSIPLPRDEAPGLWAIIEDLAGRLDVEVPHKMVLENGGGAGVRLLGGRTGKGRTELTVGFDLLAGLSPAQTRAVMAHELAHAKYVRRGIRKFIITGLRRAYLFSLSLQSLAQNDYAGALALWLAKALEVAPRKLADAGVKPLASCLRHDEFVADRVAAEICGSEVSREALQGVYIVSSQLQKIPWRDRIVHLGDRDGYTTWLREALHVPTDEKRFEIQARVVEFEQRHEFRTHPVLSDRVAALDALAAPGVPWSAGDVEAGTDWLHDPNRSAEKLLRESERLAAEEERSATRTLDRANKRFFALFQLNAFHVCRLIIFSIFSFIAFVILLFSLESNGISTRSITAGHLIFYMVATGTAFLYFDRRDKAIDVKIPVPRLVEYRQAQLAKWEHDRAQRELLYARTGLTPEEKWAFDDQYIHQRAERRVELGRTLRPLLPDDIKSPRAVAQFWAEKGASFLEDCDYKHAHHCARLAFEAKHKHLAGMLIYGISGAFERDLQDAGTVNSALQLSQKSDARWAAAWGNCLLGQSAVAEAYLVELTKEKPQNPMLWALLGQCQTDNGKPREALFSRRRSLELVGQIGDMEDEACHRYDLAKSLIQLGQMDEALVEFEWLQLRRKEGPLRGIDDFGFGLGWLKWQIVSGNIDSTREFARELAATHSEAVYLLALGDVLDESPSDELKREARFYYEQALELGFYPEVKLSLAKMALDAGDKAQARQLVIEALDAGKERPFDASRALDVLQSALSSLTVIAGLPPTKVVAYQAHLDASDTPLKLKDLWLLCYFPDEATALAASTEVFEALLPEYELEEWINIGVADAEHQPKGPVSPHIGDFRYVAE